jgi:eukaryotic-like serine/threonine-protein kinase
MRVRTVGTTKILRELGRGAMGVVYEGVQESLERYVAVKELTPQNKHQEEAIERFRREGVAYARLHHEHILQVHDFVEKNESAYLIIEYVSGADAQKLLKAGGPYPAVMVAAVGAKIASALAHAHESKLLHRDVKPANVLLGITGEVKLTDFGVVKDLEASDLTREGMVVGSLPYMAPEILAQGEYGAHSDIWALGVMLYELATGERPFIGKDDSTLMAAIVRGSHSHVRTRADLTRRLGRAIERCLARRPAKRWPHAIVLAHELETCFLELSTTKNARSDVTAFLASRGYVLEADDAEVHTRVDPQVMQETRIVPANEPSEMRWIALAWVVFAAIAASGLWLFSGS